MIQKIIVGFLILIGGFSLPSLANAEETGKCSGSGCISSTDFTISIDNFSPGGRSKLAKGNSTTETVNNIFSTIIANLIIVFGVLALLIMTIGAGYMIFHAGEESLLSRGKSIFMYGLISLVIALSAGVIVKIVTYVLYEIK